MYSIENISLKNYIKDRTYLYFRPLNAILCCFKIKKPNINDNQCDCPINVFTDTVIETLNKRHYSHIIEYNYGHIIASKVETVNILSLSDIELIRQRYA